jgi:hypothetical protein
MEGRVAAMRFSRPAAGAIVIAYALSARARAMSSMAVQ